jgi:hypothetical protein
VNEIPHIYSYTATFEDGTTIVQDHTDPDGDISLTRADGTGSRFTDVQEKEKESKLICFVIHNDEHSLGVDLRDGHFELNGFPFWQHRPDLDNYKDFRIIYVRTVQHVINQQSGEVISGGILGYSVGWQTTHHGENIKKTVMI